MKRIVKMCLLALCMLYICLLPLRAEAAETVDGGTCGDNLTWVLDSEGTLTISGAGKMESYSGCDAPWYSNRNDITSVVIEFGVTSISNGVFADCASLASITIPNSVTSIGDLAFSGCTSLVSVVIPEGVTSINYLLFWECSSLTSVVIPESVTSIDELAFGGCNSLTSLTIPESVTSIGDWAFFECTSLTDMSLPNSLSSLGEGAFSECISLSGVTIPNGVTKIDTATFYNCNSLISVTISESVISIGESAFDHCSSLTNVTIPGSVATVGKNAFAGCTGLTDVTIYGTSKSWANADVGWGNEALLNAKRTYIPLRLSGSGRWDTAIKVADELKATLGVEKFSSIIVASGNDFADALAGSYLSTQKCAPILLSWGKGGKYASLDTDNINYIRNNLTAGGTVYILGGTSAVPSSYETDLSGIKVVRLAGGNRYETNLAILKEAGVADGSEILVCTGTSYADSLSVSATGKPILLVQDFKGKFYGIDADFLGGHNYTFTIIGGAKAVGDNLKEELGRYGEVTRLSGDNRMDTSVKVAERYFTNPDSAVVAYAWNYPDGLCGGALAYAMHAPLILTMEKWESAAVAYVDENNITTGYVLGGAGLVSDSIVREIFGMAEDAKIPLK